MTLRSRVVTVCAAPLDEGVEIRAKYPIETSLERLACAALAGHVSESRVTLWVKRIGGGPPSFPRFLGRFDAGPNGLYLRGRFIESLASKFLRGFALLWIIAGLVGIASGIVLGLLVGLQGLWASVFGVVLACSGHLAGQYVAFIHRADVERMRREIRGLLG